MAIDLFGKKAKDDLDNLLRNADELQRLAAERFISSFTRLTATPAEPGDTLIFQFKKTLSHDKRVALIKNFDIVLKQRKFFGMFIPEDVDFVGVIAKSREPATKEVECDSQG